MIALVFARSVGRLVRFGVLTLAAAALASGSSARAQEAPPAWAHVVNPPDFRPPPDDGRLRRVPDSTAAFTLTQVRDLFFAPDWHPGDRRPMPDVVARGRRPGVFACGFCHRADGSGGPEKSPSYIVRELYDFQHGARAGTGAALMTPAVDKLTLADMISLAAYAASLKP
jgi:cytochrome c553